MILSGLMELRLGGKRERKSEGIGGIHPQYRDPLGQHTSQREYSKSVVGKSSHLGSTWWCWCYLRGGNEAAILDLCFISEGVMREVIRASWVGGVGRRKGHPQRLVLMRTPQGAEDEYRASQNTAKSLTSTHSLPSIYWLGYRSSLTDKLKRSSVC